MTTVNIAVGRKSDEVDNDVMMSRKQGRQVTRRASTVVELMTVKTQAMQLAIDLGSTVTVFTKEIRAQQGLHEVKTLDGEGYTKCRDHCVFFPIGSNRSFGGCLRKIRKKPSARLPKFTI